MVDVGWIKVANIVDDIMCTSIQTLPPPDTTIELSHSTMSTSYLYDTEPPQDVFSDTESQQDVFSDTEPQQDVIFNTELQQDVIQNTEPPQDVMLDTVITLSFYRPLTLGCLLGMACIAYVWYKK